MQAPPSVLPDMRCTPRMTVPGSRTLRKKRRWWKPCAKAQIWWSKANRQKAQKPPTPIPSRASLRRSTRSRRNASRALGSYIACPPMLHPMVKSADIPMGPSEFVEKIPLERYLAPEKPSLIGLTRAQLADALGSFGVPQAQIRMRVQQLWHWIYIRGMTSFDEMSSVSIDLRAALAERCTLARPEIVAEQVSVDGTRKWLLR